MKTNHRRRERTGVDERNHTMRDAASPDPRTRRAIDAERCRAIDAERRRAYDDGDVARARALIRHPSRRFAALFDP